MIRVSDAVAWEYCRRRAWFALHPPVGLLIEPDPFDELMASLGEAHEHQVLMRFEGAVEAESEAQTMALMTARTRVIYQPQFQDAARGIVGKPDFLILTDNGYQVGDAKLGLSLNGSCEKKAIKAQLGVYRQLAGSALPGLVFLGNGEVDEVADDDIPIAESFLTDMAALELLANPPETHYGHSKCSACPFHKICVPEFKAVDEVTLNPKVEARARPGLIAQGIRTLTDLAEREARSIGKVPFLPNAAKRRAILQARSIKTGEVFVEDGTQLPEGVCVHFDVEVDPSGNDGKGEVYLWGLLPPPHDETMFDYVWKTAAEDGDYVAWESFLQHVRGYQHQFGDDLLIVHYSPYEVAKIKQYSKRYGMEDDPTVAYLLAEESPLFDLAKIVKDDLILPLYGYSLKAVCKDERLVNFQWQLQESGSQWSVVRYYDYLAETDEAKAERIQQEILTYNLDDVRATAALWDWVGKFTS